MNSPVRPLLAASLLACSSPAPDAAQSDQAIQGGYAWGGDYAVGMIAFSSGGVCTGTLLSPRVVLTAGHCIQGEPIEAFCVGEGAPIAVTKDDPLPKAIPANMRRYAVDRTAIYPGFDVETLIGSGPVKDAPDLGLLHLAEDVVGVVPSRIVTPDDDANAAVPALSVGKRCWVVGYGRHDVAGTITVEEKRAGGGHDRLVVRLGDRDRASARRPDGAKLAVSRLWYACGVVRVAARLAVASALVAAVAAACASYGGASGPADAAAADSGYDASPSDASRPEDDGGGGAPDAAARTFCTDASWVCDDFDDPPDGWPAPTWSVLDPSAVIALVDATSPPPPSPPNAAMFTIEASDAAASSWIHNDLNAAITGVHCELEIFVAEHPTTIDLLAVRFSPAGGGPSLSWSTLGLYWNGQSASVAPLSTNAWTKVVFDVDLGKSVTFTLNGVVQPTSFDAGGVIPTAAGISIDLGASRGGPSPSARGRVLYDDVRCDVR